MWESALVTPIYRGQGSKDDNNNNYYYPISVLPLPSKIFEKHIHQALYSFMRNDDFLYNLQSGFQWSHFPETALICLVDQLLSDMEKDHVSWLVFLDYKKAFDLIYHNILLLKLHMVLQLRNSGYLKTTRRVEDNQLLLMECSQNIDRSHNFMVFHTVLGLEQWLFVIFVLLKGSSPFSLPVNWRHLCRSHHVEYLCCSFKSTCNSAVAARWHNQGS